MGESSFAVAASKLNDSPVDTVYFLLGFTQKNLLKCFVVFFLLTTIRKEKG